MNQYLAAAPRLQHRNQVSEITPSTFAILLLFPTELAR